MTKDEHMIDWMKEQEALIKAMIEVLNGILEKISRLESSMNDIERKMNPLQLIDCQDKYPISDIRNDLLREAFGDKTMRQHLGASDVYAKAMQNQTRPIEESKWCPFCAKHGDHTSGKCPGLVKTPE